MYHNLFDSHVHSGNSPDGEHPIIYLAESAVEKGLMGMALTDHVECVGFEEGGYRTRTVQSAVDVSKAKAAFRHRITFTIGIELGIARGMYDLAGRIIGLYPYDFVLGACHHTRQGMRFSEINFAEMPAAQWDKLLSEYFEDMAEMVEQGTFDSLTHITYPLRYGAGNARRCHEQVDVLLRLLVEKGKALEVNAARLEEDDALWNIRRYKELGGELVTIGSGAHRAERLGEGIENAMALLAGAGYEYFTFYKARNPIMLRIV